MCVYIYIYIYYAIYIYIYTYTHTIHIYIYIYIYIAGSRVSQPEEPRVDVLDQVEALRRELQDQGGDMQDQAWGSMFYMRDLLGWLGTGLAQNTLAYLRIT